MFEEKRLRDDGTDAARTEQAGQKSHKVDEKNDEITHRRIVAGREILRNHGRNNNSPETGLFLVTLFVWWAVYGLDSFRELLLWAALAGTAGAASFYVLAPKSASQDQSSLHERINA